MMHSTMTDTSDEVLVLRAQLGEREALTELIERWHGPVWRFLHHATLDREVADDLAQDVWLAALRSLAGLRQPDRFRPWLFTIARRTVTDRLRGRYRRPPPEPLGHDLTDLGDTDAGGFVDRIVDRDLVAGRIAELEPRDRHAVSLHYLADFSVADTAEILGVPVGTVKSRLARARRLLAPQCPDTEPEEPSSTEGDHR